MPTGLIRRGGRYSVRRIIPLDLQAHYGRREIVRALGTSDPKEARRLHTRAWILLDEQFDQARAALVASSHEEGEPYQPALKAEEISPTLVSLAQIETLRTRRDEAAQNGTLRSFILEQRDALRLVEAMLNGEVEPLFPVRELEGRRTALRAFLDGHGAAQLSLIRRTLPVPSKAAAASLADLVDRWSTERKPIARTEARTRNIVDRFEVVNGKLDLQAITKQHVLKFKDRLIADGQSPANINVMIPMLGVLFNYAVANDLMASNPASKIRVTDNRRAKDKRREFDEAGLTAIFASPVYSQGLRPAAGGGEAAYWLPLLALFTGARLNELGQLHPSDVQEEGYREGDGTERSAWVIRIVENRSREQSLKNEGSERRIPVHEELVKLGFLEFARAAQEEQQPRLFGQLRPDRQGTLTGNWSKWFGRYRRKECGLKGRDTPFHSFRHTFKHNARLSGIDAAAHNELTGHETGDVADTYGGLSYPLLPLVNAIQLYRVPGFKPPAKP